MEERKDSVSVYSNVLLSHVCSVRIKKKNENDIKS